MRTLCAHLTPYSSIHQTGEAETLLKRFDADCMAAQRAAARAGAGLAAAAPPPAATACTMPPLRCADHASRAMSKKKAETASDAL